jgi:mgtE-like transporter
MSVIRVRRVLGETIPLIVFFATIELVSGGFLSTMTKEMEMLPGLLILLPPLLAMRGSIGSSLGARLSSGLHMGVVRTNRVTRDLKTNIYSSLIMSAIMSSILSVMSWAACVFASGVCIPLEMFVVISVLTGVISGTILTALTVLISIFSFGRGLDPDDVVSPAIGALGDVSTVLCLFIVIKVVIGI